MDAKQDQHKGMFQNALIDKLTKTHISVPLTIFYGLSAVVIGYSIISLNLPVFNTLMTFFAGLLAFTFIEYLVHRYVWHIPATSERRAKFQYAFHGIHHEFPKDKKRLAMPPFISLIFAAVFISFFRLIMGNYGFPFGAGFMSGYSTYLVVHYIVHIYRPPKNMFRALWRNHAIHHYKDDTVAFGVSSPIWDYVFRTMPPAPRPKQH